MAGKEKGTIDECRSVRGVGNEETEGIGGGSGMRIDGYIRTNHRPAGTGARGTTGMGKTDKDLGTGRLPKTRDEDK